jgi:hypothetical protein
VPSRAYIAFKNTEQIAKFSAGYNGHIFRDKAGGMDLLGSMDATFAHTCSQAMRATQLLNLPHIQSFLRRRRKTMRVLILLRKVQMQDLPMVISSLTYTLFER